MNVGRPSRLPQRGGRCVRLFGRFCLRLLGWSFAGALPDRPKLVVIVAPHTSNWDFVIGVCAKFALGVRAHWIGKNTLFRPPLGVLMEWLGGIPVDRSVPNDLVRTTARRFTAEKSFLIALAPEGTRKKVADWKRGFYHIACGADVPIACVGLDYRTRTVVFGPLFAPTGDYAADMRQVRIFYAGISPRYPEKFSLPPAGTDEG